MMYPSISIFRAYAPKLRVESWFILWRTTLNSCSFRHISLRMGRVRSGMIKHSFHNTTDICSLILGIGRNKIFCHTLQRRDDRSCFSLNRPFTLQRTFFAWNLVVAKRKFWKAPHLTKWIRRRFCPNIFAFHNPSDRKIKNDRHFDKNILGSLSLYNGQIFRDWGVLQKFLFTLQRTFSRQIRGSPAKKFEDEGSGDSLPLTLQRTFEQKKTGVNRNFPFHITNGHFFCVCPEIFRRFQKSLYYTTDIFSPFFKYRGIKRCPYFRESRDIVICGYWNFRE